MLLCKLQLSAFRVKLEFGRGQGEPPQISQQEKPPKTPEARSLCSICKALELPEGSCLPDVVSGTFGGATTFRPLSLGALDLSSADHHTSTHPYIHARHIRAHIARYIGR